MADRTQLKTARDFSAAGEDPFAELTKIMGFDPRQPVRRAPAASVSQAVPTPVHSSDSIDESDFGIDLERELLGDFANDEYVAPARSGGMYPQAVPMPGQSARQSAPAQIHAPQPVSAPVDNTPSYAAQRYDAREMSEPADQAHDAEA